MTKRKKCEQRSWDYGRGFFAFREKKLSVPLGCVLAAIRFVTAFAGMNNYLTQACLAGWLAATATQCVK